MTQRRAGARLALAGTPALIASLAVVFEISRRESDAALIALGVLVVATIGGAAVVYRRQPYVAFIAPALLVYALFLLLPAIEAFRYSLYDWSGIGEPTDYIGLSNFRLIFSNTEFPNALANNVQLFAAVFILQNLIALPLALALDTRPRFHQAYRAILFTPVIMSLVATGYVWHIVFAPTVGMLNPALDALGLSGLERDWLSDAFLTFKVVILVQAWQYMGLPIVLYLAGLQTIPEELKEAARIDGASSWAVFHRITFPLLAPAFTIVTTATFITMFRVFDIPFILGGPAGAPLGTTDVVSLVIYRQAFGISSIVRTVISQGLAVAGGVVLFIFLLVAVSVQVVVLRRRELSI